MPVDETRYLAVAWEMWLREDFLVPFLNGVAYSHKPPLLFWMINLGWGVFGVNDWWPRLVAPFFGLACLYLSARTCRRLWPNSQVHFIVPIILIGTCYWGIYTTLTMFDLIITFWTMVGVNGLISVWQGRALQGWFLFSLAIGLGILTKGPIILVYLLPIALLAPYWANNRKKKTWISWYLGIIGSVIIGIGIALVWAIPAAIAGGEEYRNAIFWGQSAGRVIKSFAHQKPVWWYIIIIPGLLMPWILWPSILRKIWFNVRHLRLGINDPGMRLVLIWIISTLLVLSMISGKQPHYLLPIFPALGIAYAVVVASLSEKDFFSGRWDMLPLAILFFTLGTSVAFISEFSSSLNMSDWSSEIVRWWCLPLIGSGLFVIINPPDIGYRRLSSIFLLSPILVISMTGALKPTLSRAYDLRPISTYIAKLQSKGYTIAYYGKYHGQFHFLGRLDKRIVITGDGEIKAWLNRTPQAKIVSVRGAMNDRLPRPEFFQKYRDKYLLVWDRSTVLANSKAPQRQ